MTEPKTKQTAQSPHDLIAAVEHPIRQRDAATLMDLFARVTGYQAKVWGPSMIGFGRYHYTYDSGHSGESLACGFAPRKAESVVYTMVGYSGMEEALARLGPHKLGKSCLYIKDLAKVDLAVLEEIVTTGLAAMKEKYDVLPE
jgi:Domain of unknown function (DU1801)